jgi:hypothetical protein
LLLLFVVCCLLDSWRLGWLDCWMLGWLEVWTVG